jgi:DNA protecting protein DprA
MELTTDSLTDLYVLDSLKGFGPQKFKALHDAKVRPTNVLQNPRLLPIEGRNGDKLRDLIAATPSKTYAECRARAERQLEAARKARASILTYDHPQYPRNLLHSGHPVPILYARGNPTVLLNRQTVACVGSRKLRAPYDDLHREFAQNACKNRFAVVSGFALGADTAGHEAAQSVRGQTICVMPGGLDRPFPPENRPLWNQFLEYEGAVFVSEFPFGTAASALTLRKRNKVIVALSLGVLVSQSSSKGGAMNAFRFAVEQKKSVATFKADGADDTSGNSEIGLESKVPTVVFSWESDQADRYNKWLRQLSSSI